MKNIVKKIITVVFIFLLCYFVSQIVIKIKHKKEVAALIKTIPNFEFQNIRGGRFTNENIKKNCAILFVYFNSECEYCNEEAQIIKENITQFNRFHIVFISFESPELISAFAVKHQLNNYDNIDFLSDTKVSFATIFDVQSLPCLVLYDKNKTLIEKIKGQTKTELIIQKLNKIPNY